MPFTPTILLADDNYDDQVFLKDAFDFIDAKVNLQIFNSGIEAIDYLKTAQKESLPHLIVLDYNMPKLNGAEVLFILKHEERLKHIPKIILSTAKNLSGKMISNADAYFVKPDNVFDLKILAIDLLKFIKSSEVKNSSTYQTI